MSHTLNTPEDAIHECSTQDDIATWDSLRHLVVIMALEEAFAIRFTFDEIGVLDSVAKLVTAVNEKISP